MRGRFKGLMARVKWKLVAAIIAETKRLRETIRRAPRKRPEKRGRRNDGREGEECVFVLWKLEEGMLHASRKLQIHGNSHFHETRLNPALPASNTLNLYIETIRNL